MQKELMDSVKMMVVVVEAQTHSIVNDDRSVV